VKSIRTLQQAIVHFADETNCLRFMVEMRWPNGVECPVCGRMDARFLENQRKWQCKSVHHHRQFSVKVGTIFEDSPIPLSKWLPAAWQLINCKNGISSYEIHRAMGVTQKTAWFMLHRLRLALQNGSLVKLGNRGGEVEVDETYIGGRARNMHRDKRLKKMNSTSRQGKTTVMGILERGGEVRTAVVPEPSRASLEPHIYKHVKLGAEVFSDALASYDRLNIAYRHQVIDHAQAYVNGKIHTNGLENFWSLLKRGLRGTYVAVEPFHLFRYVDEQSWRYNNRELQHDGLRFREAMKGIAGKRLTYANLTGKGENQVLETSAS
jgi:transposase-like protein